MESASRTWGNEGEYGTAGRNGGRMTDATVYFFMIGEAPEGASGTKPLHYCFSRLVSLLPPAPAPPPLTSLPLASVCRSARFYVQALGLNPGKYRTVVLPTCWDLLGSAILASSGVVSWKMEESQPIVLHPSHPPPRDSFPFPPHPPSPPSGAHQVWGYLRTSLACAGRAELMAAVDGMDQEALARQLPLSG